MATQSAGLAQQDGHTVGVGDHAFEDGVLAFDEGKLSTDRIDDGVGTARGTGHGRKAADGEFGIGRQLVVKDFEVTFHDAGVDAVHGGEKMEKLGLGDDEPSS